ncbi:hypothetical protein ACFPT7_02565 [Acidicapsa dinghuensis]|uniref:Teneurin NHL domain-containing protein n=1 Tax=Acidicapsa dinghuensis TaxID=2218256 RepID=A0ABW1EA06_9BACT|nr:hypothetical protein [Acidicapsa dinghuensis]
MFQEKSRSKSALITLFLYALTALVAIEICGCGNRSSQTNIGTIATVAGNGKYGDSGDGGPAAAAQLNQPTCAVMNSAGDLFIGDIATYTVRKVAAGTGIISTYAGNGIEAYSGDGGPATDAAIAGPSACVLDSAGNLYIADAGNNVVRRVDAATGIITTIAGYAYSAQYEIGGFAGDGGLATKAKLYLPRGLAIDAAGDLFISDSSNQRVRKIDSKTGIITTIAGNGTYGYSGDDGAAVQAMVSNPEQLALDGNGNLYITEQGASVIVRVNLTSGLIQTVAGNGASGDGAGAVIGDGGPATKAQLSNPQGVALDSSGNIFIADSNNQRVRMVSAATGIITTVAGTSVGYVGDGGPADLAKLHNPEGLFFDSSGVLYIADSYNSVVRKIAP